MKDKEYTRDTTVDNDNVSEERLVLFYKICISPKVNDMNSRIENESSSGSTFTNFKLKRKNNDIIKLNENIPRLLPFNIKKENRKGVYVK